MLLPIVCPVCERPGPAPCPACWQTMRAAPSAPPPDGLSSCRSLLLYADSGRELLARLKYHNGRGAIAWLAGAMAALVDPVAVDVVTWAPTTSSRARSRGFDQAELLARAVARRLARPCRRLLHRLPGPPQTGRDRAGRFEGPAFTATRMPPARRVLLVDDVITTGATVSAAARALRHRGALDVIAVSAARTPLKVLARPSDA